MAVAAFVCTLAVSLLFTGLTGASAAVEALRQAGFADATAGDTLLVITPGRAGTTLAVITALAGARSSG